jgi:hypothetical protein
MKRGKLETRRGIQRWMANNSLRFQPQRSILCKSDSVSISLLLLAWLTKLPFNYMLNLFSFIIFTVAVSTRITLLSFNCYQTIWEAGVISPSPSMYDALGLTSNTAKKKKSQSGGISQHFHMVCGFWNLCFANWSWTLMVADLQFLYYFYNQDLLFFSVSLSFFFPWYLGFRTSCLLSRHSSTWATPPALFL